MAHDLRAPLGNILSLAEFIPEADAQEREELLNDIKASSEKSMEIVKTILEAAILGEGKITLEKSKVTFKEIFNEVEREFNSKLGSLKLQLNFDKNIVSLDRERMIQVVSNLLSNAIKYSIKDSTIEVSSKEVEGKTKFQVKNIIDKNLVDNRKIGTSEENSIGFGLEIVNEILELHDSKLETKVDNDNYLAYFLV